jgi:hypothetical protein
LLLAPAAGFAALTALLGLVQGAGAATPAAPKQATSPDVSVQIQVIHATKTGKFIDQRVRQIQQKLTKLFNFQSYRLVQQETTTLPLAVETLVKMPFKKVVRLTQQGQENSKIKLRIQIGLKQAVSLKLASGGTFLQGITLKNGQNYILAISATIK